MDNNLFTCTRQAKMQKFIPVIEKYADLHIGGHQHCFSATKPLRTDSDTLKGRGTIADAD